MLSNPNKRIIPSNFVIPKKQKKSEQPSYSNAEELLQTLNVNDSRFHMEVGRHFLENLFDPSLKSHVRFVEAKRVVNNDLYKKFLNRQQKLTRQDRPHDISYGFLLLDADSSELEFICNRGYASGYSFIGDLGNAKHGVYLSRYSDLCTPAPFFVSIPLRILIFKILPGRSKAINLSSFNSPADSAFDSHVPRVPQQIRTLARHDQFRFSQIFLYEFDNRGEPIDFPTSVYPFAFVLVNITPPEPQLVALKPRLDRDSVVWTGLLAFKNETLDRVEMIASHTDNVMKPRGLESKIEIQMLIPFQDCLNYSPISKLLTAEHAGSLVRNPEIIMQDKNGLLQCASYFTIVQNNSPLFYRVHHAMRNEHVAAISFINGTLMVLIPNGEFSSLLSLPRYDKPVFHCIFLGYRSFITGTTNLEIDTTEEEMFKHVPFKGEKVDAYNEQVHARLEKAHASQTRFHPTAHLVTTSLMPNRMPPPPTMPPYPFPPRMNVPPPGFPHIPVATTNASLMPLFVPPPPPPMEPKSIGISVSGRPDSASPPTVEMPDASPRELETASEERKSKESSPKEVGETPKPNYLQQALMNIRQLDQEKKSASESPSNEEATMSFALDNVKKSTSSVQALRDPRVRKLLENDPKILQKIADLTAATSTATKHGASKRAPSEPIEEIVKEKEEAFSRPYSPSDALLDTSDDIDMEEKAISSTDEAPKPVAHVFGKEEAPSSSFVSSSTSSYIPPSGRSILGNKTVPASSLSTLTGSFIAQQPTSEKVDFDFTTWRSNESKSRRDSAMSPLLQIDEPEEDTDEPSGEVSSTTAIPDTTTQQVEKEDEIAEPSEPLTIQVLPTEPKVIPLHSAEDEEAQSPNNMGDSWRNINASNDFDFRDVYKQSPQISPSSTTPFVLPDFTVPPPILPSQQPSRIPIIPDLTRPPPTVSSPVFGPRPKMHIPPPPQMFAARSNNNPMPRFHVKSDQPTSSLADRRRFVLNTNNIPSTDSNLRRGASRFDRPPTHEKEKAILLKEHFQPTTSTGTNQQTSNQSQQRGLTKNLTILVDPQLIIQGQIDINEFQQILEAMREINSFESSFHWHIKYHRHIEERLTNIDDRYADLIMEFETDGVIQRMAPHFCDESKVKNPYSGAMICAMTAKRSALKENSETWVVFMTGLDPNSESGLQFCKNEIDLQTPSQMVDYCTKMIASVKRNEHREID